VRVPYSWLRDFAPIEASPDEVWAALDDIGLTVDGVERVGEGLGDIVVAKVLSVRAHPDADRIRLVDVDAGDGEPLQIACGAWNFGEGDVVPLAPVGSTLPGGMEIGRRKMRGEWSNGMLCSASELGLGEDGKGLLLLSSDLEPGMPVTEALGIEPDVVLDIDVTANRPDALSVAGVARDLAAKLGLPFQLPEATVIEAPYRIENLASIQVEAPDLCPRFTVRVLEGVPNTASPGWMQRRLTMAGMRPINLAVDASNYVMLELGQPTHPYDLDRLPGEGLLVRAARPGEVVRTLDGVDRRTGENLSGGTGDCLICDAEGNPVGIAGIMGGEGSGIVDSTERILLEAAYFLPMAIARTSKRLRLRSEASARFERGVDPEGIDLAADRYCTLVGAAVAAGRLDERAAPPARRTAGLRIERVSRVLGVELNAPEVSGYLAPLGFTTVGETTIEDIGTELEVVLPSWRPDATAEIDLIEEVARHHGYERLGRLALTGSRTGGLTPHQRFRREVRSILVGLGFSEASTPPLVGPEDHERSGWRLPTIAATNPAVREESILRATLLPGLLRSLAYNVSHRNAGAQLFELGHVFRPADDPRADLPLETERVALVAHGQAAEIAVRAWRTLTRHLRLAAVELSQPFDHPGLHPHRSAQILSGGTELGVVGEVHPEALRRWGLEGRVAVLDLDVEALGRVQRRSVEQTDISRFPSADIDLSFEVADTVSAEAVERSIRRAAGEDLENVELFDVYRGEGVSQHSRGLAYRLRLRSLEKTLTDGDIAAVRIRIVEAVAVDPGASLRG
jgi:phenylalanyl-tRNA synthetase beta chain